MKPVKLSKVVSFGGIDIDDLVKEIKLLEEQIEDMKCCGNCKHVDVHLCGLLGGSITPEFCCVKWEKSITSEFRHIELEDIDLKDIM